MLAQDFRRLNSQFYEAAAYEVFFPNLNHIYAGTSRDRDPFQQQVQAFAVCGKLLAIGDVAKKQATKLA